MPTATSTILWMFVASVTLYNADLILGNLFQFSAFCSVT